MSAAHLGRTPRTRPPISGDPCMSADNGASEEREGLTVLRPLLTHGAASVQQGQLGLPTGGPKTDRHRRHQRAAEPRCTPAQLQGPNRKFKQIPVGLHSGWGCTARAETADHVHGCPHPPGPAAWPRPASRVPSWTRGCGAHLHASAGGKGNRRETALGDGEEPAAYKGRVLQKSQQEASS